MDQPTSWEAGIESSIYYVSGLAIRPGRWSRPGEAVPVPSWLVLATWCRFRAEAGLRTPPVFSRCARDRGERCMVQMVPVRGRSVWHRHPGHPIHTDSCGKIGPPMLVLTAKQAGGVVPGGGDGATWGHSVPIGTAPPAQDNTGEIEFPSGKKKILSRNEAPLVAARGW